MVQKYVITIQKPSDESLRITTKAPSGAHGKLEDFRLMHWCAEQMTAEYKRNSAEEPTDQNRGNLLSEPRKTYENGGIRMTTQEIKRLAELKRRIFNLSQEEQKEYLVLRNVQHKTLESLGYEMKWDKENLIFHYMKTEALPC